MNHKSVLFAALVAGLLPVVSFAQTTPAPAPQDAAPAATAPAQQAAPTATQAPAAVAPTPYAAKIALVAFEQAVYATNEGQRSVEELRKKYQPQKEKMDALAADIDSLKKQLQSAPATLSDAERAARLKTIDTKDKQYQRDADDAQNSYNTDLQEALGKIAQKVNAVMLSYVEKNGYTMLLNVGSQQSQVMWTATNPNADITEAVVAAYNASSGVTAPPPAAPSAAHRPATTTPRTTTPKPAAK
ncbi:MAG TPA: OmpH family outer membrane protein [Acidobacteriaceae bacterium]